MQVRWSDVDLFGHVNNAAFLRYLDDALAPIRFRLAPVVVEVWVPRLGRSSVDFAYEVLDGDGPDAGVALRARSRMVQLDRATHTPRPFTDEERATFAAFPGPSPELRGW